MRCFTPKEFGNIRSCQLHHFSDASESGYGTVTYLRFQNDEGNVHCSFVNGKSRVAPLKPVTIPRLELMAATMAVRVNEWVMNAMEMKIDSTFFWTDSTSVLKYIRNDSARFHTFVANRLAVIKDGSQQNQWRYVDSNRNPADDASRGHQTDKWLRGPKLMSGDEHMWPLERCSSVAPLDSLEIKAHVTTDMSEAEDNPTHRLIQYFSEWHKVKKSVAWLLRLKSLLKGSDSSTESAKYFTVEELNEAERSILMIVQRERFPETIAALKVNKKLKMNSSLSCLKPILDNNLLRVGGRISNAP